MPARHVEEAICTPQCAICTKTAGRGLMLRSRLVAGGHGRCWDQRAAASGLRDGGLGLSGINSDRNVGPAHPATHMPGVAPGQNIFRKSRNTGCTTPGCTCQDPTATSAHLKCPLREPSQKFNTGRVRRKKAATALFPACTCCPLPWPVAASDAGAAGEV